MPETRYNKNYTKCIFKDCANRLSSPFHPEMGEDSF